MLNLDHKTLNTYIWTIEQNVAKAGNMVKRKSLNINLFFIELLYKINITLIMLIYWEKKQHSSCDF